MNTSPTDGQGLRIRPEEFEALAHRWPRLPEHAQADYLAKMTRAQKKRFERTVAEVQLGEKHFASKLTTRQDVVNILAMYVERNVMPLAARMDEVEAWMRYCQLPWHRKLRVVLAVRWELFVRFLATKGIRIVRLEETPEATDGEVPDHDRGDAPRGAVVPAADVDREVHESPAEDGLPGRDGRLPVGPRGGGAEPGASAGSDGTGAEEEGAAQEGRGLIEVVPR